MNPSRLKNFGKSTLWVLCSGGTIELIKYDYLIYETRYNANYALFHRKSLSLLLRISLT